MPAKPRADVDQRVYGDFQPNNEGIGLCQHPIAGQYIDGDETKCRECGRTVEVLPPTPRVGKGYGLTCNCCKRHLPDSEFQTNNSLPQRRHRSRKCRYCTAFQDRLKRYLAAEEGRRKNAERAARRREGLTQEQKAKETRTPRKANSAAVKRYQARKAGTPVPVQRRGAPVQLLKPICRIRDACPLAKFCVDKAPSDKPLKPVEDVSHP